MMNFKEAKANTLKGIGNHSTLITFIAAVIGVGATVYLASKEIPKAQAEVKEILAKDDLDKKQKVVESAKAVGKTCWKTAVVAIGTVLLVTGTSAISAANTAATVAGLTNTIQLKENQLKDCKQAIEEIPNKKTKEEVQQNIAQKAINRATANCTPEDYARNPQNPNVYLWVDLYTGAKFKATCQQIDSAEQLVDARITMDSYQTIFDFYEIMCSMGVEFLDDYPQLAEDHAWTRCISIEKDAKLNDEGETIHYICYNEPSMDF